MRHHLQNLFDQNLLLEYVKKDEKEDQKDSRATPSVLPVTAMRSIQRPNINTGNVIGVIYTTPSGKERPAGLTKKEQDRIAREYSRRNLQELIICQADRLTEERVVDHTLANPDSLMVFSDQDLVGVKTPNYDALVVSMQIGDWEIRKIMIDGGSSADILFYPTFCAMGKRI